MEVDEEEGVRSSETKDINVPGFTGQHPNCILRV
jgi:hypothetical protein